MMALENDDKAGGEILRSLLSFPKIQTTQVEVTSWSQMGENYQTEENSQPQEQVVWQIEPKQVDKQIVTSNQSVVRHIPVTYLTTDDRNVTFSDGTTVMKPVTYVLSRNVMSETSNYCTIDGNEANIILNEPQKIVLVREVGANIVESESAYNDVTATVFAVQENECETTVSETQCHYEEVETNENQILIFNSGSDLVEEEINCDKTSKNKKLPKQESIKKEKTKRKISESSDEVLVKIARIGKEKKSSSPTKSKVEKKISSSKKPLKKKKKEKPKGKLKPGRKPLVKKLKTDVKAVEKEKAEQREKKEKGKKKKEKVKEKEKEEESEKKEEVEEDEEKEKGQDWEKEEEEEEEEDEDEEEKKDKKKRKEKENKAESRINPFELTKLEDNADQVAERFKIGCECSDTNCFNGLNPDAVFKHRLNLAELTKAEHDMYLMGVIMATVQNLEETCRHKERIRIRSSYAYQGKKVCLTAFIYLQYVTLYQMKRLRSHLKNHGVSPRTHGNLGRKPPNTFSLDIYHCATNFFQNYIKKHSVKNVPVFTTFPSKKTGSQFSSGSTQNSKKTKKKTNKIKILHEMTSYYLPPECTKKIVHREYKSFCEGLKPSQKVMKYSTFTNFLKNQFPNVKFQKVDKKQDDKHRVSERKSSVISESEDPGTNGVRSKEEEPRAENFVQTSTVVYIPAETVHVSQPTTLVMAPEQNPHVYNGAKPSSDVENQQIVLNGQHLQFYSGGGGNEMQTDFTMPNQVVVGNQIYSAQCVAQAPSDAQQIYAMDAAIV